MVASVPGVLLPAVVPASTRDSLGLRPPENGFGCPESGKRCMRVGVLEKHVRLVHDRPDWLFDER